MRVHCAVLVCPAFLPFRHYREVQLADGSVRLEEIEPARENTF